MELEEAVRLSIAIPGWMEPEALRWLGFEASRHERIVEVGSWQGRSTKAMALMTEGVVFSVDNLTGEKSHPVEDLNGAFRSHLADEIADGKVRVMRGASEFIAARWLGGPPDMVFIDGDHTYPAAMRDMAAWKRVAPEALFCGHDFSMATVKRSLEEVFPEQARGVEGDLWVIA